MSWDKVVVMWCELDFNEETSPSVLKPITNDWTLAIVKHARNCRRSPLREITKRSSLELRMQFDDNDDLAQDTCASLLQAGQ